MSILKRQRELKKQEKAARKRARRHGQPLMEPSEPRPTVSLAAGEDDEPHDETTDTDESE